MLLFLPSTFVGSAAELKNRSELAALHSGTGYTILMQSVTCWTTPSTELASTGSTRLRRTRELAEFVNIAMELDTLAIVPWHAFVFVSTRDMRLF